VTPLLAPWGVMQLPPLFDSWDLKPAALPPRSRLYSQKPLGIGTPLVESITGYVSRLADAHAVSVSDMVSRELSLIGSKPARPFGCFVPRDRTTGPHGFRGVVRPANGWGETAKRWVAALERATLQTNLRFLTLLPYEGVFSNERLFRRNRAWCPACYEDCRRTGAIVYEPLLWTIRVVTICLQHRRPLEEVCPHCHGRMRPVGPYARPGHCSKCLEWLGREGASEPFTRAHKDCETDGALWRAQAVAELLAAAPQLNSCGAVFKANFRACVTAVAEGNAAAFAQISHMSRPGLMYVWKGRGLPEMGTLLRICHHLDIPLMAFLVNDPGAAAVNWERAKEALLKGRSARRIPLSRTTEGVRLALQEAVREQPPPSLPEIVRRLNYQGVKGLYQVDRALSKQIAANYRKSGRSHWWRKPGAARICERVDIRKLLERSLTQEHTISVHQIALSLGYDNEGYIWRKFPELCRAISEKITEQKQARIRGIETALNNVLNEEPPPSLQALARRFGHTSSAALRYHFSTLCDKILARRRSHRKRQVMEWRKMLRSALLEWPPPCFPSLCRRLNLSPHSLQKMYPRECAAIRSRFVRARKEILCRRQEKLGQEVRQIVQRLHRENKCPSLERVTALLSKGTIRQWAAVRAAVSAARQELRLAPLTQQ